MSPPDGFTLLPDSSHRYQCRGDDSHVGGWLCIGIGGLRVDRAVAAQIVEAVSDRALEAAIQAAGQVARAGDDKRQAIGRELEDAHYEASLAARRYEAVVTIHWTGGRHTKLRVSRVRCGRYPADRQTSPVEVIRKLGGQWPDREVATTMNRMRCKPADGKAWTTVRVRKLRERLGIEPFDPAPRVEAVSADEAAVRLGICVGSVQRLIREGVLPATQLMHSAPWQIPIDALGSDAVQTGVQAIVGRRPSNYRRMQDNATLRLPGI